MNYSRHLFWDTNRSSLDPVRDRAYIIRQVLEYGLLADWILLLKQYGLDVITAEAKEFRELDPKTVSFLSALSGVPQKEFRCYKEQPSMPSHWNF